MKYFIWIILLFTLNFNVFSQNKKNFEFTGALRVKGGDVISYKLKFQVLDNNKIEGESITDFYGENYTISKIKGSLNKNLLTFSEVGNVTSKSAENDSIFCYVNVSKLNLRKANSKRIINGKFIGTYNNTDTCAEGSIYLVGKNLLDHYNISNDSLKRLDSMMKVMKLKKNAERLEKGDTLDLKWKGEDIIIDVWDGSKEDNDVIDIYFNDKIIRKNLVIKNERERIAIPYNTSKGFLKVVAISEGSETTNTVTFLLSNKYNSKPFISKLYKGEQITVKFNR